jgi:hypothetical protein
VPWSAALSGLNIPLNTTAARDGYQVSLSRVGRKTTSVIGTITRQADPGAGLPVLILKIPNNPILQSRTRPDRNCGATLARTRMCVHDSGDPSRPPFWKPAGALAPVLGIPFPSILHFGEADGDAPV